MADKPILFSASMVKALLDGRKTQTRRIITPQPPEGVVHHCWFDAPIYGFKYSHQPTDDWFKVRLKAAVSDYLYVREHWRTDRAYDDLSPSEMGGEEPVRYLSDDTLQTWGFSIAHFDGGRHRQGMHMPRWASRLTLPVTEVKVERLQDISEADALAEGIIYENVIVDMKCYGGAPVEITADRYWNGTEPDDFQGHESAVDAYAELWDHINGPGSWEKNPWVSATKFQVIKQNIDQIGRAA